MANAPKLWRPQQHQPAARAERERERWKQDAERRGTAAERGYGSQWRKARAGFLRKHPLCCCCEANGRVTPATMVDHVVPHEGDWSLFWRREDWQGLCDDCNQRIKQPIEIRWKRGEAEAWELKLDRPIPELFF